MRSTPITQLQLSIRSTSQLLLFVNDITGGFRMHEVRETSNKSKRVPGTRYLIPGTWYYEVRTPRKTGSTTAFFGTVCSCIHEQLMSRIAWGLWLCGNQLSWVHQRKVSYIQGNRTKNNRSTTRQRGNAAKAPKR